MGRIRYDQDIPKERQRKAHRQIDRYIDAVVHCRCGQIFAEKTLTKADAAYRRHIRETFVD